MNQVPGSFWRCEIGDYCGSPKADNPKADNPTSDYPNETAIWQDSFCEWEVILTLIL